MRFQLSILKQVFQQFLRTSDEKRKGSVVANNVFFLRMRWRALNQPDAPRRGPYMLFLFFQVAYWSLEVCGTGSGVARL